MVSPSANQSALARTTTPRVLRKRAAGMGHRSDATGLNTIMVTVAACARVRSYLTGFSFSMKELEESACQISGPAVCGLYPPTGLCVVPGDSVCFVQMEGGAMADGLSHKPSHSSPIVRAFKRKPLFWPSTAYIEVFTVKNLGFLRCYIPRFTMCMALQAQNGFAHGKAILC